MGQALYRTYRSTSLSEIVGQEHITVTLQQAVKTGKISHAYLFTGPRGTGKTSIARILAHAINNLEYSTDPHLDIIEIDAASNRRIDEIRDLRDKVYIAPTSAQYKVYIIDEVHMLTREAFNALLKTLEEPPAHVVFILATTDAHKLPETIISRTQRYTFRPVEQAKVVGHLAFIAKQQNIMIDSEALALLAQHGEGSFRDSISMLDQVSAGGVAVTADMVRQQLGVPSTESVESLLSTIVTNNVQSTVAALQHLYDGGYRAPAIAEQLSARLRQIVLVNDGSMPVTMALRLLADLLEVPAAYSPERFLELCLLQSLEITGVVQPVVAPAPPPKPAAAKPKSKPSVQPEPSLVATQAAPALRIARDGAIDDTMWAAVLAELKKQYNTIYGIVRMAQTDFSQPGRVGLAFTFAFHQRRINDAKNRKIVADTIEAVSGQRVELVCTLADEPRATPAVAANPSTDTSNKLQDIASMFGGGELL